MTLLSEWGISKGEGEPRTKTCVARYTIRNLMRFSQPIADGIYKYRDFVPTFKGLSDEEMDGLFAKYDKLNDVNIVSEKESLVIYDGSYELSVMEIEIGVYAGYTDALQRLVTKRVAEYEINTYGLFRSGHYYYDVFFKKIYDPADKKTLYETEVPEDIIQKVIEHGHYIDTWR